MISTGRPFAILTDTLTANPTRELAAIMFSDIVGYTAIMGRDEHSAMRALAAHRELLRSILPRFNGRLVGEIGDGTLSSFHSAVDALRLSDSFHNQGFFKREPFLVRALFAPTIAVNE